MIFKPYECDFGIKYNGISYDFEHVNSLVIDDPERNRLTRGTNAKDKIGLPFKDGLKEPKKWTAEIMNMSADLKAVFETLYATQDRIDVYCISRKDGSKKQASNAILSNQPQQLTLNDTAESMAVSLEFETFDSVENHKS